MSEERIDKDTIKVITTNENIIDLRKIREHLEEINKTISELPKPKTQPDQETLEFWNMYNINEDEKQRLIEEKESLEKLLSEYEKLMVKK